MTSWPFAGLGLFLALAPPAMAQTADPAGLPAALAEIVSIASFGMVSVQPGSAQSVPEGSAYRLTLPVNGLRTPESASMTATARPAGDGLWDIDSIKFPAAGTAEPGPAGQQSYAIGSQDITARIDPALARPSSYSVGLGDVRQDVDLSGQVTRQAIARYDIQGTLSGETDGRIDLTYGGKARDWHIGSHMPNNTALDILAQEVGLRLSVTGLDRAKGDRLRLATRSMAGNLNPPAAPGSPARPRPAPPPKAVMRDLLDNAAGLLTKMEGLETIEGMRVAVTPGVTVDVGRVLMAVAADTADGRLDTKLDVAVDGFAMPSIPADMAVFVPRRVTMRPVLAGVPTDKLLALLRGATADDSDEPALGRQLDSLLADPNVTAGIDAIAFDSGPLVVTGTARVVAAPNNVVTLQLHLAATGIDALVARVQGQPALQQVIPLLFIAKGMGRQEGSALVWDIVLGDGAAKVNGVPVGQPPAARR